MNYLPIYKRLIKEYADDIHTHALEPGKQIDSINKIMLKHSVSRETAKTVLSHLADEGLIVKVPGKGSFVAEPENIVNKWGLILPMYSSNMEELIYKLTLLADEYNMELEYYLHYNNADEEVRLVSSLVQHGYDTLFIVPNYNEKLTSNFYSKLRVSNSKLFLVDYTMSGSSFNYVIQSYDLGVRRAAEHLTRNNDGNFLFVKDSAWSSVNMVAESMIISLENYALSQDDREVFSVNNHHEITRKYIEDNSIGGIICYKDIDAIKIYDKLKRMGFNFPTDISLVNYGNTELIGILDSGITAIDCLYGDMVDKIRLMYNSNNEEKEQHVVLPELIIRST